MPGGKQFHRHGVVIAKALSSREAGLGNDRRSLSADLRDLCAECGCARAEICVGACPSRRSQEDFKLNPKADGEPV